MSDPTANEYRSSHLDTERLELRIHEVTNRERQRRGHRSLAWDPDLCTVARYHSQRMSEYNDLFHIAPDGEQLSDRTKSFGYDAVAKRTGQEFCHSCGTDLRIHKAPDYCPDCGEATIVKHSSNAIVGENVAFHQYSPDRLQRTDEGIIANATVNGWLDSQPHRRNLLSVRFEREAIGVTVATEPERRSVQIYITQNFS